MQVQRQTGYARTAMRKLTIVVCVLGATAIVAGQNEAPPTFEVASLKQNVSGDGPMLIQTPPGNRITVTNVPLRQLITIAHQLQPFQLVGGPSWITNDHFDIVAKVAGEQKPFVAG